MPDPSSPSTSSARDAWKAVDDAWQRANDAHRHSFGNNRCTCGWTGSGFAQHRSDMRREAALGVTYTPPCDDDPCVQFHDGRPHSHGAPRLALIDVLVASGALEPDGYGTTDPAQRHTVYAGAIRPQFRTWPLYRIPSSKES